eukprot:137815_1
MSSKKKKKRDSNLDFDEWDSVPSPETKPTPSDEFKGNEHKSNQMNLKGMNIKNRIHTWSPNDIPVEIAKMQLKEAESVKKKKKKEKDKTKVKAKFPESPPGQFYNCFGESVTPHDILYAFQFIDIRNDGKITIDEM